MQVGIIVARIPYPILVAVDKGTHIVSSWADIIELGSTIAFHLSLLHHLVATIEQLGYDMLLVKSTHLHLQGGISIE